MSLKVEIVKQKPYYEEGITGCLKLINKITNICYGNIDDEVTEQTALKRTYQLLSQEPNHLSAFEFIRVFRQTTRDPNITNLREMIEAPIINNISLNEILNGRQYPNNNDIIKKVSWMIDSEYPLFLFQMPIFIANQLKRHRYYRPLTIMELSRRYTDNDKQPMTFTWPKELLEKFHKPGWQDFECAYTDNDDARIMDYYTMTDNDISKQAARTIMPVSLDTIFYVQYNIEQLASIIRQRNNKKAQPEIIEFTNMLIDVMTKDNSTLMGKVNMEIERQNKKAKKIADSVKEWWKQING